MPPPRTARSTSRARASPSAAAVRRVHGHRPQDQGQAGQLRHQRLQAQVDLEGRRAAAGLRHRQARTMPPRRMCETAGPTSASCWTARSAAGPRAARRPGPGRASISWTPAWRTRPRPRRRPACARAASTSSATLKDVERPCRRAGCKRTWTDKRGGQLARAVRGKTGDPYPQLLRRVREGAGRSAGSEISCKTENCTGTWTWTKAAAAGRGRAARAEGAGGPRSRGSSPRGAGSHPGRADLSRGGLGRRLPRSGGPRRERGGRRSRGGQPREAGAAQAQATPRDPAARAALPGLRRVPQGQEDARDPLHAVRDADLLAAREPAADPPRATGPSPAMCGACKRDATEAARAIEREALRHPGGIAAATEAPAAAPVETPPVETCAGAWPRPDGRTRRAPDLRRPTSSVEPPTPSSRRARARRQADSRRGAAPASGDPPRSPTRSRRPPRPAASPPR